MLTREARGALFNHLYRETGFLGFCLQNLLFVNVRTEFAKK